MSNRSARWQLELGAEVHKEGVSFRVWAPKATQVEVILENDCGGHPLRSEENGYFTGFLSDVSPGSLYWYRLDGAHQYPDPCSRFQPQGPHGPSQIVDPFAFSWHDEAWQGIHLPGQVIYEMHIGTFTPTGTFESAIPELAELKQIGITTIEVMPIAEFPGRWNWGYDGVDLYAPTHNYGDADAFRRFVDAAHQLGLGVILDVVYNHLGPDGNYLSMFSEAYFSTRYKTDWGLAINYDGPDAFPVREFFLRNACYWISEFHLDGLRIDATQNIYDESGSLHILAELAQRTRAVASPRTIILIAENEPQDITCTTPVSQGGYGLDAMWNDDFHHSLQVAFTGRREAYYTDYRGHAQEWLSTIKRGFLYQGQFYKWQHQSRGTVVTNEPAASFVIFTQNHDQVANTLHGERLSLLTSPSRYRALTTLLLLAPQTPMLFMGQEFGATTPFLFFADHRDAALRESVYQGRREFLSQFPSYSSREAQAAVPDPCALDSFMRSKLDFSQRKTHAQIYAFHQDVLRIRRDDPVIARQDRWQLDGAILSSDTLAIRFFTSQDEDRLLVVNLGADLAYQPAPEPLLAPPSGRYWHLCWSSDDPRYGGPGIINPCDANGWHIGGASATFFVARVGSKSGR